MAQNIYQGTGGNPFGAYNPSPILAGGQAMGQAFQSIGTSIASAMEKHEKKKKEKEQEEATRVMLAGAFENNKDVAAAMGYPTDAEGQDVFLKAAAKNPNTLPTMTAFLNARALTQRLTQKEELHPYVVEKEKAGATTATAGASVAKPLAEQKVKLGQQEIEQGKLSIEAGKLAAEYAPIFAEQKVAAGLTEQQRREEQLRQDRLQGDLFEKTFGDKVDMAALQNEMSQVQLDELKSKLRAEELVAKMNRNKDGMLIFPKGDYSPAERDRAIQEFKKRENADKLLELELKRGRWDVKRIKDLVENGSSTGSTQTERALKLALKTGKITPEQFVDFQVLKVKKDIGLAELTPHQQYSIAKNLKAGANMGLESYANLLGLAEQGGQFAGKEVKFSKDGNSIIYYSYTKDGKRVKKIQPYTEKDKELVEMYKGIMGELGLSPEENMDTTTGNDADQSDEDLDQLVTDSIFGE